MDPKRPVGREKKTTEGGNGVHKRGEGLGTGPVGNGKRPGESSGHAVNASAGGKNPGSSPQGTRSSGRRSPLILIVAALILLIGGGGGAAIFGGSADDDSSSAYTDAVNQETETQSAVSDSSDADITLPDDLDLSVAEGARDKYTKVIGDGEDTVTLMVYMCGTDLESKYGMATNDLNEMLKADIGDKVNIIVYTGGCTAWKNSTVSSSTNQIYQIKDNKLVLIEDNLGSIAMTKPSTLTGFIEYCAGNFPANRYDLILWDHGGGSVSGYGYDEKFSSSGSMSLSGIKTALGDAGVSFDFIGFDACLMATLENGLMLADYADYMIASEETEPGVGWYYTNWLTALGQNTSISTVELGSKIVDDFVSVCASSAQGQKTTLSVTDLAELSATVPDRLTEFSTSTSDLIQNDGYKTVAAARSDTREFASSSKIDQVDLINLAENLGTDEAKNLADALAGAVKYNKTSYNMTNANGISIYFPFRKLSYVDTAVNTYTQIGMDSEYSKCIEEYASLETTGQYASSQTYGDSYGSLSSLFGTLGSYTGSSSSNSDALTQLMGSLFMSGRSLSTEESEAYVSANSFDPSSLKWADDGQGNNVIGLTEDQWSLVTDLEMNMFYDDGEGYIDLGLDNVYDLSDDNMSLIASTDRTWLAINGQPVAYYHMTSESDEDGSYIITGYVPAYLNGSRVNIILEFDSDNPDGYIAGVSTDYQDAVEVQAKNIDALETGDKLDFICDYYSYDGTYQDSYYLGDEMTVTDEMTISNVDVGDGDVKIAYCFTDIYNNSYWTESLTVGR